MQLTCDQCGKQFQRAYAETMKREKHFCSRACQGEWNSTHQRGEKSPHWQGGMRQVPCALCGKLLERPLNAIKRSERFFCDQTCRAKWRSQFIVGKNHPHWQGESLVTCEQCGKQFRRADWHQKRGDKHIFCGNECRGKWLSINIKGEDHPLWRGGKIRYYGKNWIKQRLEARVRDGYRCQHCGVSESELHRKLDVHHLISLRDYQGDWEKANRLDNLISLCPKCHRKADQAQR